MTQSAIPPLFRHHSASTPGEGEKENGDSNPPFLFSYRRRRIRSCRREHVENDTIPPAIRHRLEWPSGPEPEHAETLPTRPFPPPKNARCNTSAAANACFDSLESSCMPDAGVELCDKVSGIAMKSARSRQRLPQQLPQGPLQSGVKTTKRGKRLTTCPSCVTVHVVSALAVRHHCQHCGCAFELVEDTRAAR